MALVHRIEVRILGPEPKSTMLNQKFICDYGMVNPRADQGIGAGNRPLYTALWVSLLDACLENTHHRTWPVVVELDEWRRRLPNLARIHTLSPGLFKRQPTDPLQESHDNMLGWVNMAAIFEQGSIIRPMLWRNLKNAGVFNTDGKLTWDDWLWRFPHLWAAAWPVGIRPLQFFYHPQQMLIAKFMNASHPGGIILDFVWFYTLHTLGHTHEKLFERVAQLPAALRDQFDADHEAIELAELLAENWREA